MGRLEGKDVGVVGVLTRSGEMGWSRPQAFAQFCEPMVAEQGPQSDTLGVGPSGHDGRCCLLVPDQGDVHRRPLVVVGRALSWRQ